MSWEFYASCYRDGRSGRFSKQDLISIGKRNSLEKEGIFEYRTDFLYDDGYLDLQLLYQESDIMEGFCVSSSFGPTAMDRVVEMAMTFHCVLYWGQENGGPWIAIPCVEMLSDLPPALKDADPAPVLVKTGYDLASAIDPNINRSTYGRRHEWLSHPVTPLMNTKDPAIG